MTSLEAVASLLPAPAIEPAIAWLAASTAAHALLGEIGQAVTRIKSLIEAAKGFTQMDRPLVAEPTHIGPGLRDAVTVMSRKAHARHVWSRALPNRKEGRRARRPSLV
jgi:hypothetical protein